MTLVLAAVAVLLSGAVSCTSAHASAVVLTKPAGKGDKGDKGGKDEKPKANSRSHVGIVAPPTGKHAHGKPLIK